MTWAKYQPELFIRMAADGLSQDAAMAHLSAIAWLYQQERNDCCFPQRLTALGITPLNDNPAAAATELVRAGYWVIHPTTYEVVDHADVIRQSLAAQWSKREKDKRGQASARARRRSEKEPASSDDSSSTQANNLTTEQPAVRETSHLRLAPDGRPLGVCRACKQREPLTDGRCDSCLAWDVEEAS